MKVIYIPFLLFLGFKLSTASENESRPPEECNRAYSCLDCSTVRICRKNRAGKLVEVGRSKCSIGAPYCDSKSATCRRDFDDVACTKTNDTLLCMADGYYPDPTDCKKYYICDKGIAHSFSCSKYYDAQSQRCIRSKADCSCPPFDCKAKHGFKVPHRTDRAYFAYCATNSPVFVDSCPNGYTFNETTQSCTPNCTKLNVYADVDDSAMYYVCGKTDDSTVGELLLLHRSCTENYIFDPYVLRCVIRPNNRTAEMSFVQDEDTRIIVNNLKMYDNQI